MPQIAASVRQQSNIQKIPKIGDRQTDREKLLQIIESYSISNGLRFGDVMEQLYIFLGHRLCTNIQAEAQYSRMHPLNYIESKGLMPDAIKTAVELFR